MNTLLLLLCSLGTLAGQTGAAPAWHHPLYLGNGGLWRQRIQVMISNDTDRAIAGEPVAVTVGKSAEQADLVGAAAEAVRVCDAAGSEMLFLLTGPGGNTVTRGLIPAGATLTIPVECEPKGEALYFVYFDNKDAWQVPDFLEAAAGLRNGGVEDGEGDTPAGWNHDTNDDQHQTFWVTENPHSGKKCLKTVVSDGAEPTWIATRQRGLHIVGGATYVMTAWVKAENVKGTAGWYIHVGNQTNAMLTSPMLNGGEGTYDWKQVRAEFVAPAEANVSNFGTVLRGTGTAWFDDVELVSTEAKPALRATAAKPEQMRLREVGVGAPWLKPDPKTKVDWDYRVPLRVLNLSEAGTTSGLLLVDLSSAFARFQGKVDLANLRLVADGRPVEFYRLQDVLLFEGDTEPLSAKTYYLYFSTAGTAVRTTAAALKEFAPNPAVPGAAEAERQQTGPLVGDYAALLASKRNLAKNGSFEEGDELPTAWPGVAEGQRPAGTTMGVDANGLFGKRCAKMHVPAEATKAWTGWRQDVPVEPCKTYLFAAWLKTQNIEPNVKLHAHFRNAQGELCKSQQYTGAGPAISGTQDWTMISGLFEMPADIGTFQLHLTMNATGTVWHDGVVLTEVSPGETGRLEGRAAPTAKGLTVWPVNAVEKVFQEDVPPKVAQVSQPVNLPAPLTCARNEKEPLQLAVRSPEALKGVRVVVEPPGGPKGFKLADSEVGVVGYVPIDHKTSYNSTDSPAWHRKFPTTNPGACDGWAGMWPDPLLPRDTFDLAANVTQPVWVTVGVPKDAPAGDYLGKVRLLAAGKAVKEVPFTVHVWDFALPDESHVKAIYDCRQGGEWRVPGKSREESTREMWRFMAERRVCPNSVRFGPSLQYKDGQVVADFAEFDKAAEYYFDELKLPHAYTPCQFYLFGHGHLPGDKFGEKPYEGEYPYEDVDRSKLRPEYKRAYQACLKAFWDHVKEKGWARKMVLYISDEPCDSEEQIRAQMKALCEMIHEVDPKIPIYCSTWHQQPEWEGYLNVWGIGHYGIVSPEKIRQLQESGATIWWTTDGQMCTDTPYCAIERLLPHYCFKYGAEAYEFWGVDWLTYNPYEYGWHKYLIHNFGPDKPPTFVRYPNGDGFLAYPGGPIGHAGPVSSVRLEQAREGVEDYEYLYLLRARLEKAKAAGRDVAAAQKALDQAESLVSMPCAIGRYSTQILPDPDAVFQVKEAAARAIEALGK